MYKLVASDMDETFLDDHHRIPAANLNALRRMRELGVLFVPSSGRPYQSIMANFVDIDQELLQDSYVISYNGGFINRYGDPTPLLSTTINREAVEFLYRYGVEHHLAMHIYTPSGKIFTQFLPPEEVAYVKTITGVIPLSDDCTSLDFVGDEDLVKILYMSPDMDELRRTRAELEGTGLIDGLDVAYSSNRYLEFNAPGVNKGVGLVRLAELLGIPVEETMAVGDNSNDIPMICAAGMGVAVANASEETRQAADYVCEADNNDGGVAEAIERFVLKG